MILVAMSIAEPGNNALTANAMTTPETIPIRMDRSWFIFCFFATVNVTRFAPPL